MSILNSLAMASLIAGIGIWLIAPRVRFLSRYRVFGLYASGLALVLWLVADTSSSSAAVLQLGDYQIAYSQTPSNNMGEHFNRVIVIDKTGRRAEYMVDVDSERCRPLGFSQASEHRWRLMCGDRMAAVYIQVEPLDVVGGDCTGTICLRGGELVETNEITSDP